MRDHIVGISIVRRVSESDPRHDCGAESKGCQVRKVYDQASDSSSDAASDQRVSVP